MKYSCTVIAVKDVALAKKFYEDLFGLELYQDYGRNIVFSGGLSLQQEFGWLVNIPDDQIVTKPNNIELCFEEEAFDDFLEKLDQYPAVRRLGEVVAHSWGQRTVRFYDLDGHLIEVGESMKMVINRFLSSGMTMEDVSQKMDASVEDLKKLLQD